MKLTMLGLAVGLAASYELTGLLEKMLYEVTPTDTWTFMVIPFVLMGVAVLACYVPARRATRVDPIIALRCE